MMEKYFDAYCHEWLTVDNWISETREKPRQNQFESGLKRTKVKAAQFECLCMGLWELLKDKKYKEADWIKERIMNLGDSWLTNKGKCPGGMTSFHAGRVVDRIQVQQSKEGLRIYGRIYNPHIYAFWFEYGNPDKTTWQQDVEDTMQRHTFTPKSNEW